MKKSNTISKLHTSIAVRAKGRVPKADWKIFWHPVSMKKEEYEKNCVALFCTYYDAITMPTITCIPDLYSLV
ncbi:MAG: hypothetical protein VB127_00185 [Sphaerochaeta sp.]|nr:hypothetical protein [Sphaerochaeta sp.]